jgi:hypothetical protein
MTDAGRLLAFFGLFAGIWKITLVLALALILYGRSTSAWRRWFRFLGVLIPSSGPVKRRWPWLSGRRLLILVALTLATALILTKVATYTTTPRP